MCTDCHLEEWEGSRAQPREVSLSFQTVRVLSLACVSPCLCVCVWVFSSLTFFSLLYSFFSIWFDRELLRFAVALSSFRSRTCTCLQMTSVALLWQWRPRPGLHPHPFLMIVDQQYLNAPELAVDHLIFVIF